MAWLSVGTSNEDLIQKMVQNGVLREGPILEAFRATDRGDFVKPEDRIQAYSDRPFKKGFIHLSAPHMYITVLKALELNAGKSFLNVGSGSGYLSCLAASLLGEEGVSHGVEISEGACQFSREKAKEWHAKLSSDRQAAGGDSSPSSIISLDGISFVHANCFDLDVLNTVNTMKYDRIYVGAGCPESRKEFFLSMLADNGIMVVPINEKNQMLSIRKFYGRVYSLKPISNVNFAPLLDTAVRPDEEALLHELAALEGGVCLGGDIQQSILKVKAAPASASFIIHPAPPHSSPSTANMTGGGWQSGASSPSSSVSSPASNTNLIPNVVVAPGAPVAASAAVRSLSAETVVRVRLPALVWAPARKRHLQFPPEFRRAVLTILLANNRFQTHFYRPPLLYQQQHQYHQYHQQWDTRACMTGLGGYGGGSVGCLPHQIWLLIFSYANREWFSAPRSEVQALSMELAVERRLRRAAEDRLKRAEEARRVAEQERDMYRTALLRQKQYMGAAGAVQGPSGSIFWAMGGNGNGHSDGEGEEEEEEEEGLSEVEEGEEEEEEEEWEEEGEDDLGDEEGGSEGESEEEEEEEAGEESDGESVSMTVTDGDGPDGQDGMQQDEEEVVSTNSISSGGFADVMEEPLFATITTTATAHEPDGAMVVEEQEVSESAMLHHAGESLPTSANPNPYPINAHHIWFHNPDSPLTTTASATTAWQEQSQAPASHSFAGPFPAPITQHADLGSCSFEALSPAPFGSLSSDLTGTTTLASSLSHDSTSFPSTLSSSHLTGRRHRAVAVGAASTALASRPASDERISDCTAASDGYFEGEDEGEDEEEETQFETDEL